MPNALSHLAASSLHLICTIDGTFPYSIYTNIEQIYIWVTCVKFLVKEDFDGTVFAPIIG